MLNGSLIHRALEVTDIHEASRTLEHASAFKELRWLLGRQAGWIRMLDPLGVICKLFSVLSNPVIVFTDACAVQTTACFAAPLC